MAIKVPLSYRVIILILLILALVIVILWLPSISIESIFFFLVNFIVGWVVIIIIAIIGAFLLGMYVSHRMISHGSLTPFEEEILKMREEIREIHEKINKLLIEDE